MSAMPSKSSVSRRPAPALSAGGPARPLSPNDSWWTVAASAVLACLALSTCGWVSLHLQADPALHTAALFVHLASLILGFGAVLVADYYALLWLSGRCTLRETLDSTTRLHVPIWSGLVGLIVSGAMLHPDFASALTRTKLALVLILTLNGLQAGLLNKRMHDEAAPLARRTLIWGAATALVSQVCWWGAVVIGFTNSQH
ncbi:hypothetical protein [Streptomyces mirabilis]|uniref:hypothetical protein n=2 Tax=Streptomyces TaxID=1883 RepID=UPI0022505D2A|nr:hypothetical protein [Streptomyces mirabilis]MCX4420297.1 hypothetical protein [Streptomyces mirabilis]